MSFDEDKTMTEELQADLELVATELHGWKRGNSGAFWRANARQFESQLFTWLQSGDGMLRTIELMWDRGASVQIESAATIWIVEIHWHDRWPQPAGASETQLATAVVRAAAAALRAQAQD